MSKTSSHIHTYLHKNRRPKKTYTGQEKIHKIKLP